jgi:hypothetical protein
MRTIQLIKLHASDKVAADPNDFVIQIPRNEAVGTIPIHETRLKKLGAIESEDLGRIKKLGAH